MFLTIYSQNQDRCPSGYREDGISLDDRDFLREKYCDNKNQPCCLAWHNEYCNMSCAEARCIDSGGHWSNHSQNSYICRIGT